MGELFLTDFGPIDETADGAGVADCSDCEAADIGYGGSPGLTAVTVEGAIDELAELVAGGGFSPTLTTPSEATVADGGSSLGPPWPTTDKILMLGYGDAVTFGATAAYPETPRVVSDEGFYVEYYAPPVVVGGAGELWEIGVQIGLTYGAGPSGRCVGNVLPFSLDSDRAILTYQYPGAVNTDGASGYFSQSATIWKGVTSAMYLTTEADVELVFGIGLFFDGTGTGVITVYGGSTYARRLA